MIPCSRVWFAPRLLTDSILVGGGKFFDYQHTTQLRGIAILMILVGHISGAFHTVVLSPLASAGVTIFMILSGYGLQCSFVKNGLKHFWSKKYLRVMLPYTIVITIWLLVHEEFEVTRYLYEITGIKTTYWYVDYQIKWYVVFFFTLLLIPNYSLAAFTLATLAMFVLLHSLAAEQSFAFLIGVIIARHREKLQDLSRRKWLCIACISVIVAFSALAFKQLPEVRAYLGTKFYSSIQLIINLGLGLAIISLSTIISSIRSSFLLLISGYVSFEIYLLHFPFYGRLNNRIELAILLIIGSIVASYLFMKLTGSMSARISKFNKLSWRRNM